MIDTHAHLNFQAFSQNLTSVIQNFKNEGGKYINVVGAKIDSSLKAIQISQQYPSCFAAVGIHPHHINSVNNFEKTYQELKNLTKKPKVIAIGETGLDYHHYKNYPPINTAQKEKQKKLFLLHLHLAYQTKTPLIIHCRKAYLDLLNILTQFMKSRSIHGVFHCFEGKPKNLFQVLSLGFFIGFDGNITYQQNAHLRKLVKKTPLSRLLLETDSPYLTPEPKRGLPNQPAYLKYTAQAIAKVKNEKYSSIISITSKNAQLLFNFKGGKIP